MERLKQIEIEICAINYQLLPLEKRQRELIVERRKLHSLNFIKENSVRLDDVELSEGNGKPFFNRVNDFSRWMKNHSITRRFCEWNNTIYLTSEIMSGRMDPTAPGSVKDLEKVNV